MGKVDTNPINIMESFDKSTNKGQSGHHSSNTLKSPHFTPDGSKKEDRTDQYDLFQQNQVTNMSLLYLLTIINKNFEMQ